jgi:hypothetical protein
MRFGVIDSRVATVRPRGGRISNHGETFHGFGNRMNRAGNSDRDASDSDPRSSPGKKTKENGYENSFACRFVEFLARIAWSVALSRL